MKWFSQHLVPNPPSCSSDSCCPHTGRKTKLSSLVGGPALLLRWPTFTEHPQGSWHWVRHPSAARTICFNLTELTGIQWCLCAARTWFVFSWNKGANMISLLRPQMADTKVASRKMDLSPPSQQTCFWVPKVRNKSWQPTSFCPTQENTSPWCNFLKGEKVHSIAFLKIHKLYYCTSKT